MSEALMTCDDRAISLGTVLQALDLDAVTGTVEVGGGRIELRDGAIVGATLGAWGGLEALYELSLQPPAGQLVVRATEPAGVAPLGPTAALVLEAARRVDDFRRVGPLVLGWAGPRPAGEAQLLDAVDGRRAVWEIADEAGRPRSAVAAALAPLLAAGALVSRGDPKPAPDRAELRRLGQLLDVGDVWAALDHGRSLLRSGRLAEARRAFQAVLARRPDDRVAAQNLRRLDRLVAGDLR